MHQIKKVKKQNPPQNHPKNIPDILIQGILTHFMEVMAIYSKWLILQKIKVAGKGACTILCAMRGNVHVHAHNWL